MRIARYVGLLVCIGLLAGCSDDTSDAQVLKSQTEVIEKAEDVNQIIEDQAQQQRAAIDEQSR
jgi:predicted aminopeptidase